jgi:hypothetical protein
LFARAVNLLRAPRVNTGLAPLDRLVGGMPCGTVNTFYGDQGSRDALLFTMLASTASRGSPSFVVSLKDYHSGKSIDTYRLAEAMLWFGADPEEGLSRVYVSNVYGIGQLEAADALAREALARGVELVAVTHLSEMFSPKSYAKLVEFLGKLQRALEGSAVLALFAEKSRFARRPLPELPSLLKHTSNLIVRVEDAGKGFVRVVVEKGPLATPKLLYARSTGWGLLEVEGWFDG